jgi:hypothetical protein
MYDSEVGNRTIESNKNYTMFDAFKKMSAA